MKRFIFTLSLSISFSTFAQITLTPGSKAIINGETVSCVSGTKTHSSSKVSCECEESSSYDNYNLVKYTSEGGDTSTQHIANNLSRRECNRIKKSCN